jgi:hypothetical protein
VERAHRLTHHPSSIQTNHLSEDAILNLSDLQVLARHKYRLKGLANAIGLVYWRLEFQSSVINPLPNDSSVEIRGEKIFLSTYNNTYLVTG